MASRIESINNELIKYITKQSRIANGTCILLSSTKILLETLDNNVPIVKIFCTQKWYDKNYFARKLSDIVIVCHPKVMQKLAITSSTQEVIFTINYEVPTFEVQENKKYLILEKIQDPGNFGTIIRSAIAFGYKEVFVSEENCSIYNDKVIRSTMGLIFKIKINYFSKIEKLINSLKAINYEIYCSSVAKEAIAINEITKLNQFALIIGNEAQGASQIATYNSNVLVNIPIENVDSINVASATAILLLYFNLKMS